MSVMASPRGRLGCVVLTSAFFECRPPADLARQWVPPTKNKNILSAGHPVLPTDTYIFRNFIFDRSIHIYLEAPVASDHLLDINRDISR